MGKHTKARLMPSRELVAVGPEPSPWRREFSAHGWLYIFVIPGVIYMLIFVFMPLLGLIMAFQRFSPYSGSGPFGAFIHSEFVGFDIFRGLFTGPDFWRVLRNTLAINISSLIFYFPAPIILALLLNEIQSQAFKRTTQTIVYIPHFISWVIVGSITFQMFNAQDGILMMLIKQVFPNMPNVLSSPKAFIPMLLGQSMWKETGFGTIIYLASLASVDPQLYEAATVDGANRWQKLWNITLPGIAGTIVIMLILKLGQMLNTGYEQIFLMQNSLNRSVSDVFDTYIYTMSIVNGNYSLGTAMGLFKSVVGMFMVIGSNSLSKRLGSSGLY